MSNETRPTAEQFGQAAKVAAAMRAEIGKALIGQPEVIDAVLCALLAGGHVLVEGVPGLGKTLLVQGARAHHLRQLRPHPVHARPDARRRHRAHALRPEEPGVHHAARAGVRQPAARRRDQPRAGEDPGRAARGDAGGAGHDRGRGAQARAAVHGARDAEPDRAGRHLRAARGAARPLPAQGEDRLSVAGRRAGAGAPRHRGQGRRPARGRAGGERWSSPRPWSRCRRSPPRCAPTTRCSTTRSAWCARRAPGRAWSPAPGRAARISLVRAARAAALLAGPRLRHARRREAAWRCPRCATASCPRPSSSSRDATPTRILKGLLEKIEAPRK